MNNYREILEKDTALREEVKDLVESKKNLPIAKRHGMDASFLSKAMIGPRNELPKAEAMIQLHLRPALGRFANGKICMCGYFSRD
jgi:hypothetical protein